MNNLKKFILSFCILLIISTSIVSAKEFSLSYDLNGNLIQDEDFYYEYDSFNHLIKVREDTANGKVIAEYFYDDTGARVKKIEYPYQGTSIKTYYINKHFVRVIDSSGTHDSVFYYDGTFLVGKKDPNGKKFFYHSDHLGSTNLVTDEYSNIIEETSYTPFGVIIKGGESRYLFTGKEKDKETELMYYGARYYSPDLKHFTQADTIIQSIYDPQSFNRYSYVRNNPLKYTDPSGNFVCGGACIFFAGVAAWTIGGSVVSAGWDLGKQVWEGKSIIEGTADWSSAGLSAVKGGVGGFVAGLTFNTVSPVFAVTSGLAKIAGTTGTLAASTMTGNVARQVTSNIMNKEPITSNVFEVAASGAKLGGIVGTTLGTLSVAGDIFSHSSGKLAEWQDGYIGPVSTTQDATYYRYYGGGSNIEGRWLTPFESDQGSIASRLLAKIVKEAGTNPYTDRAQVFIPAGTKVNIGFGVRGTPQIEVLDYLDKLDYLHDIALR